MEPYVEATADRIDQLRRHAELDGTGSWDFSKADAAIEVPLDC